MAAFLTIAVLLSLLVTGARADGYGSQTPTPSTSTPAPYTPTPAPYSPQPATPPKPAHGTDDDDDKKLVKVRVEGVVVCQSCAHRGSESLDGAAPLPRAKVMVTCRGKKNRVMAYRLCVADSDGYFHAEFGVEPVADFWSKEPLEACFARLLSSPDPKCNVVTNINGGLEGARLHHEGKKWIDVRGFENVVHAVHPLAFCPKKCEPTHHY